MTKEISLTQGYVALVDDDDFEWINKFRWHTRHSGGITYAVRHINVKEFIYMHRLIANTPDGMETDHINLDGLDNRRCNLRICTHSENMANRRLQSNNKSKRRGVVWHKQLNKWQAGITYHGKYVHIGLFDDLEDAAEAYHNKSKELFGEFAYTELRG